ncbi:hypothetical protein [Acinetobacter nosocomialis]|uniref:hypothetical protein n=1 Tax=Acinetobacter nosocomialis TaxID=106654 RepID=UPI0024DEF168|nr:hypothetical protein [Acinetobacter nosocomialis]
MDIKLKNFLLLLLMCISCTSYAAQIESKASQATIYVIDDLKNKVTGSNGKYFLNNKTILFDFDVWGIRLNSTFERCDDAARYFNSESYQKDCYTNILRGYDNWVEVSKDPAITFRTWMAAASDATRGNDIDFDHWVSMIRVYQAKFDKLDKDNAARNKLDSELDPYEAELRQVVMQLTRERQKPSLFGHDKKMNELLIRQKELQEKIAEIRNK